MPKSRSALPKKTGVRVPWRKASRSNSGQPASARPTSSARAAARAAPTSPASFGSLRPVHVDGGAVVGVHRQEVAVEHVPGPGELRGTPDRPGDRGGVEGQGLLDLLQQLEGLARLPVHLVDEGDDRDVAQAADLEQLLGLRLDALGRVEHHDGGIDRGQGPVGVLREILVARRIQQVEDQPAALEGHDRGGDRDPAVLLDLHPVRPGPPRIALGPHGPRELDGAAAQQQLLGQGGLAGVGVGDDGEGAPPGRLGRNLASGPPRRIRPE